MASITVRNPDDTLESRLRTQVATHGLMEDEARGVLRPALGREPARQGALAAAIRARFAPMGGVDLPDIPRDPMRARPTLDGCGVAVVNPWTKAGPD